MPKIHPSITRALTIAMFVTSAFADTVTLKSGEHIEGKITRETDKDLTIETQSGGIIDERTVPKTDIQKVDKTSPEVEAYRGIERIQLQPNSFPATQYDPYIAALDAYVKQYPNSVRTIDVQTTLNAFQAEQKRVEGGEVKIDGNWLSKTEVEKEKVQIGGRIAFNYMKAESAAGNYIDALNAFAALEKSYPGAATTPDAIDLAKKIVPALKAQVERAIPEQKILKDQRDNGIKTSAPSERPEMEAAAKREDANAEAAVKAAETAGRWAPLIKSNAKCLTSLQSRISKEESRLAGLNVSNMRESLESTEAAKQKIAAGDLNGATLALQQAGKLWPANEFVKRLTEDVAAQKSAASASAAATPEPAPQESKGKATPKPKASTPKPSASAAQAPAAVAAKSDDDKPFYMTLPGAVVVVVGLAAILGGANFLMKAKKRRAEEV